MSMYHAIGVMAGEIWKTLDANGEMSVAALKKALARPRPDQQVIQIEIDPEEMGTEWLRRATESNEPPSMPRPFSVERADVAAELPVGNTDREGNTELHQPRTEKAATELSPNAAELAQRGATETHPGVPDKPHE